MEFFKSWDDFMTSLSKRPAPTLFRLAAWIVISILCVAGTAYIWSAVQHYFFPEDTKQAPLVQQEANNNSSSSIIQIANISQEHDPLLIVEKIGTSTQLSNDMYKTGITLGLLYGSYKDPRYVVRFHPPISKCDPIEGGYSMVMAQRKETDFKLMGAETVEIFCTSKTPLSKKEGLFTYERR